MSPMANFDILNLVFFCRLRHMIEIKFLPHRLVFRPEETDMHESIQSLLDNFPEGIIQIRQGLVLSANAMAKHYLPQLSEGSPLPDCLVLPKNAPRGAGYFTSGPTSYCFSCSPWEEGHLLFFRPAPQSALTGQQLEGALEQLRSFLGEFLAEVGPLTHQEEGTSPLPSSAFSKSFHRVFRLLGNLEYMQQSASGRVSFQRATLDLDGLCRQVVEDARDLLEKAGIALDYEGEGGGLLIPGDAGLLKRLLLGLIANSARAAQEGRITVDLRRSGGRALLSVSDNGPLPSQQQLDALFQQGSGNLPLPGQGAGLGLSIARDIVRLHNGAFLVQWGQSSPTVIVSLPTGPLDGRASIHAPRVQRDGGLNPVLVELSDVLPAQLFSLEGLD